MGFGLFSEAVAQVGPELNFKDWKTDDHWADTVDDLMFTENGKNHRGQGRTSIFYWDSSGRIKFPRSVRDPFLSLGYEILTLDNSSDDSFIDGQLNDVIVVGRMNWGKIAENLHFNFIGGVGTANDGYWSNSRSWYPMVTLDFSQSLSEDKKIHYGLTFDGNLALWKDLPLPYLTYIEKISDDLNIQVGLPQSQVEWNLFDSLKFKATYSYPLEFNSVLTYQPLDEVEALRLFARYARTFDGFYLNKSTHRRIFYEHDRVELGVRWVNSFLDLSVGGGYLLGQNFYTGYDIRDLNRIEDLRGQFYLSILIQGIL